MRFENKVAMVTGASVGIGRACTVRLAKEGAKLVLFDINAEQLDKVKEEVAPYTTDVLTYTCDVSDEAAVNAAVADAMQHFGRIDVPCLVCRHDHDYVISRELFFKNEFFELPCALSGLGLCWIGDGKSVADALTRSDEELSRMLTEAGAENLDVFKQQPDQKEEIPDAQVYDIVRFIVKELEAENAISCRCKPGEGDYDIEMLDDSVCVFCKNCGAKQYVSTASLAEARAFLDIDELKLK